MICCGHHSSLDMEQTSTQLISCTSPERSNELQAAVDRVVSMEWCIQKSVRIRDQIPSSCLINVLVTDSWLGFISPVTTVVGLQESKKKGLNSYTSAHHLAQLPLLETWSIRVLARH